jgi:hypothetical protein
MRTISTAIAHTARWDRPLPYARTQNVARTTPHASDDSTGSADSSTNISRSHDRTSADDGHTIVRKWGLSWADADAVVGGRVTTPVPGGRRVSCWARL